MRVSVEWYWAVCLSVCLLGFFLVDMAWNLSVGINE